MVMLFLETLLFLADLTLDQSAHAMGLHSIKNGLISKDYSLVMPTLINIFQNCVASCGIEIQPQYYLF